MDLTGMAPWDAAAYWSAPQTQYFSSGGAGGVQILKGDPTRVAIVFAAGAAAACIIAPVELGTSSNGFAINGNQQPLVLTFDEVGPLVMSPWYMASGAAPLFVIAMCVPNWPGRGVDNLISQQDAGQLANSPFFKRRPARRAKLYGNKWQFARGKSPYDIPYWE